MSNVIFIVERDPNGGFRAHAIGESIFTQADDIAHLREMVRDAVRCHWPDQTHRPRTIRLRSVVNEVITL